MYNLDYLKKLSDNDENFIKDILNTFQNNSIELIQAIEVMWDENPQQLSRMIHKFIPSLNFIGAKEFKPDLKQLEVDLLSLDDKTLIASRLEELKENLASLLEVLNNDLDF